MTEKINNLRFCFEAVICVIPTVCVIPPTTVTVIDLPELLLMEITLHCSFVR